MMFGIKKILFSLMALLIILAVILTIVFKTDAVKNLVSNIIVDAIQSELDYKVEIHNLALSLPAIVSCDSITLRDEKNEAVLEIEKIYASILPSLRLFREIKLHNISAEKFTVLSSIKLQQNHSELLEDEPSTKNIPDININTLSIDEISIKDGSSARSDNERKNDDYIALNLKASVNILSRLKNISFASEIHMLHPKYNYIGDPILLAEGSYDINGKFLQLDFSLESTAVNMGGNVKFDVEPDNIDGTIKYNSDVLGSLLANYLPGSNANASGTINLGGSLKHLILKTDGSIVAKLDGVDFYTFPDMHWQTTTNIAGGRVWGSTTIKQANFDITGNFAYQDNVVSLKDFIAKSQISEKRTSLVYDMKKNRAEGNVTFKSKNIKDLSQYLPFVYQGEVDMKGRFAINQGGKKIAVDINSNLKNIESQYFKLSSMQAKLKSPNVMMNKVDKAEILFKRFIRGGLLINEGTIQARESANGINLNSNIVSKILGGDNTSSYPLEISINQDIKLQNNSAIFDISSISGKLSSAKISMAKPSKIQLFMQNNAFLKADINLPELIIDKGNLSLSGNISTDKVNVKSNFNGITKSLLNNLLTKEFSKSIFAGEVSLSGSPASPRVSSAITVKNVIIDNSKTPADLFINNEINNNKLSTSMDINIRSENSSKNVGQVKAILPLSFQLIPFKFDLHKDRPFELEYVTKEKFNFLSILKLPPGHKLKGILDGSLFAKGTLNNPNMRGNLTLSSGKYSYKSIGLKTKDITAKINATGNKLLVQDIKIGDYFGKLIEGNGEIKFSNNLPYKFSFETKGFNLLNNPYIQGVVSGKIDFTGNLDGIKSKGNIVIGPMEIKIPERFNKSFPELNVVKVIDEAQQDTHGEYDKDFNLGLDIIAQTSDEVFVRGLGVNTRLKGKLHIRGTADKPNIEGKLVSVKGKFNEFGKQLDITRGKLVFNGSVPPSPYIDIVGTMKDSTNEIRLGLQGPMLNPSINISSTPAMSKEDALSVLLFGSTAGNVSPFQAFQLANGMRKLSGQGRAIDPFDVGKKVTGLDEINIRQDSRNAENTSVGFGKHLSDKFYIEVEQGFQDGTKTKIEVELSPKITLEGSTESTGNSNVGINWRFDY